MISLLAGNSRILLTVDEHGGWTDLFYPYPGLHQQLRHARLGIYDEGAKAMSWVDQDGDPPTHVGYIEGSNATRVVLERLGLNVTLDDMVHPDLDIVIRRITLGNPSDTPRRIRLFHYQCLSIGGSIYQDTAYWEPTRQTILQYKRSYYFQICGTPRFDHYTCGEHTLKGLRGSYVDAEDGRLEGNAISHGSADSVVQWNLHVPPHGEVTTHMFMLVGRSLKEVNHLHDLLEGRDPELFTNETIGYWNHWVDNLRPELAPDLSVQSQAVYRRSLFVMHNCTSSNGAIIASPDSRTNRSNGDGYNYCWWRDGGYVCQAMSESGMHESAAAFLRFAGECQEEDGSFLHRHFPDGYLGATWHPPSFVQVDQTAAVVEAAWHHYHCTGNLDELLHHWDMVRRAADFLMQFVDERGLPLPSFDLWEEHKMVGAYSVAAVVRGLRAAANVGQALAKRSDFWNQAADRMQEAAIRELWNGETGTFYKSLGPKDSTIDASALLANFFEPGDPRAAASVKAIEERLWVGGIGGIARYEGDQYYGEENPWIICTLWLAQSHVKLGNLDRARDLIEWAAEQAGPGELLPEQMVAATGEHVSVVPLVWSHSTFVQTVHAYTKARAEATDQDGGGEGKVQAIPVTAKVPTPRPRKKAEGAP